MKITDALKETGKVCHENSTIGHYVAEEKGELFWFDDKGKRAYDKPISWRLIIDDIWLPYHPTPEKCNCEACKRREEIEKETKVAELVLDKETNAVLWLLKQACIKEKP